MVDDHAEGHHEHQGQEHREPADRPAATGERAFPCRAILPSVQAWPSLAVAASRVQARPTRTVRKTLFLVRELVDDAFHVLDVRDAVARGLRVGPNSPSSGPRAS